ncbi:hypothetical protein CJ199_16260, partial [Brevibacterium paucivorans]
EPDGTDGQQVLRLSDGSRLAVDYTVLCLGHIEARLTDERRSYAELSREPGVEYLPPCLPAETPVNHLKPGEPVIFRGSPNTSACARAAAKKAARPHPHRRPLQ